MFDLSWNSFLPTLNFSIEHIILSSKPKNRIFVRAPSFFERPLTFSTGHVRVRGFSFTTLTSVQNFVSTLHFIQNYSWKNQKHENESYENRKQVHLLLIKSTRNVMGYSIFDESPYMFDLSWNVFLTTLNFSI